jgi:hypothetical protein
MALEDPVTTSRSNIVNMVHLRFDYGHANQITDNFFWKLLGERLSDDEIVEYADYYAAVERDETIENLTEWRNARAKT